MTTQTRTERAIKRHIRNAASQQPQEPQLPTQTGAEILAEILADLERVIRETPDGRAAMEAADAHASLPRHLYRIIHASRPAHGEQQPALIHWTTALCGRRVSLMGPDQGYYDSGYPLPANLTFCPECLKARA